MDHVHVRVYEELNDRLPPDLRKRRFPCPLPGITNVRQLLARLGVPESEVELVLINGESSSFSDTLRAGDFVSLYPVFESWMSQVSYVPAETLRRLAFMVDQKRASPGCARSIRCSGMQKHGSERNRKNRGGGERIFLARSGFVDTADLSRLFILRQQDVELS